MVKLIWASKNVNYLIFGKRIISEWRSFSKRDQEWCTCNIELQGVIPTPATLLKIICIFWKKEKYDKSWDKINLNWLQSSSGKPYLLSKHFWSNWVSYLGSRIGRLQSEAFQSTSSFRLAIAYGQRLNGHLFASNTYCCAKWYPVRYV